MAEPDDGFIARWSRRKRGREPREDAATADEAAAVPAEKAAGEAAEAEPTQSEIVDQLPDIDSLDEDSDFTVFLKQGVPEELRKRALRRLWRLNPVFANLDGLNDYDEDFSAAATVLEGLKTVYQVGKGMPGSAEPRTGDAETGGVEAGPGPGGDQASPAGDDEPQETDDKGEGRQIAAAEAVPIADQGQRAGLPVGNETAAARPAGDARPPSGRAAARRRWGRFEG